VNDWLDADEPVFPMTLWVPVSLNANQRTELLLRYWEGYDENMEPFAYGDFRPFLRQSGLFSRPKQAEVVGRLLDLSGSVWRAPDTDVNLDDTNMAVGIYPDDSVQYIFFGSSGSRHLTSLYRDGVLHSGYESAVKEVIKANLEMATFDISNLSKSDKCEVLKRFNEWERLSTGVLKSKQCSDLFNGMAFEGSVPDFLIGY
jgi:hypothetical protein